MTELSSSLPLFLFLHYSLWLWLSSIRLVLQICFLLSLADLAAILISCFSVISPATPSFIVPVSLRLPLPPSLLPSPIPTSPPAFWLPCSPSHGHAAVVGRMGPSICQRQAPPTSTTSLPLLAIIWRLAPGPETAACTTPRLRVCSPTPAPLEDRLVPCPGCDNLQRSHTLQRRWTALRVELTLGRFANVPPDLQVFHRGKE